MSVVVLKNRRLVGVFSIPRKVSYVCRSPSLASWESASRTCKGVWVVAKWSSIEEYMFKDNEGCKKKM